MIKYLYAQINIKLKHDTHNQNTDRYDHLLDLVLRDVCYRASQKSGIHTWLPNININRTINRREKYL